MSDMVVRRTYPLDKLVVREAGEAGQPSIAGYAAVFNRNSVEITDWLGTSYRERVAPGAFRKTIDEADVRALWNHDPNWVLGRNKSKTLRLHEDDHGLAIEIDPPDATWARDLVTVMKRGDVDQMSIGFQVIRDKWETVEDHETGKRSDVHVLLEARLFDVSVVTFPAFPQTEAKVRALLRTQWGADRLAEFLSAVPDEQTERSAPPVNPDHGDESKPANTGHLEVMRMRLALAERR
jgi:uncharacterized protein